MLPLELYDGIVAVIDDHATFYNMALACRDIASLTQRPAMQRAKKQQFAQPTTEDWGYAYRLPNGTLHGPFKYMLPNKSMTGAFYENARDGEWIIEEAMADSHTVAFCCTYCRGTLVSEYRPLKSGSILRLKTGDATRDALEVEMAGGPALAHLTIEQFCVLAGFPRHATDGLLDTARSMVNRLAEHDTNIAAHKVRIIEFFSTVVQGPEMLAGKTPGELQDFVTQSLAKLFLGQ